MCYEHKLYSHQFNYFNLRIQDNGLESFKKRDLDKVSDLQRRLKE